jgi:hypothetical protein
MITIALTRIIHCGEVNAGEKELSKRIFIPMPSMKTLRSSDQDWGTCRPVRTHTRMCETSEVVGKERLDRVLRGELFRACMKEVTTLSPPSLSPTIGLRAATGRGYAIQECAPKYGRDQVTQIKPCESTSISVEVGVKMCRSKLVKPFQQYCRT